MRVSKTHMVAGLITAEIQPRGEGNMLGFEEMLAEREGITAELADIGIQVKRTFRIDGDIETQLAQCRQKEVAAAAKFGAGSSRMLMVSGSKQASAAYCAMLGALM